MSMIRSPWAHQDARLRLEWDVYRAASAMHTSSWRLHTLTLGICVMILRHTMAGPAAGVLQISNPTCSLRRRCATLRCTAGL